MLAPTIMSTTDGVTTKQVPLNWLIFHIGTKWQAFVPNQHQPLACVSTPAAVAHLPASPCFPPVQSCCGSVYTVEEGLVRE